ncbi:hypothetical protein B296_00012306 [Ensete ventricosum]|uniref:Uncharacterized protein n=1 Tax=Ensete ventricosum TaxID=4639 RepID=A0A426ZIY5_ENSVE|nr:hypothetical protein B296_00012306 [Ensete ventricosum]
MAVANAHVLRAADRWDVAVGMRWLLLLACDDCGLCDLYYMRWLDVAYAARGYGQPLVANPRALVAGVGIAYCHQC